MTPTSDPQRSEVVDYAIVQLVIGRNKSLSLTQTEYSDIIKARSDLTFITAIEENFDLLLGNHFEFEKEIADVAARNMMFDGDAELEMWATGNLLNRRVLNILSSARAYIDHTKSHLRCIFGQKSFEKSDFIISTNQAYEEHLQYRVIEALRNYVQHYGFPIHRWTLKSRKVGDLERPDFEYGIDLFVKSDKLKADGSFKKRALEDLDSLGGEASLIWLLRSYLEVVGDIHKNLRDTLAERIGELDRTLNSAINRYSALLNPNDHAFGIAAVAFDERGFALEKTHLVPEAMIFRKKFATKNRSYINFSRRYVSSRASSTRED